ncbi:hypothetical protein AGMMS49942_13020 [Spirochaetia bacterium]|nr:hypothetical protein AGMMS49942_13020 [Spirochaetia bacterium]
MQEALKEDRVLEKLKEKSYEPGIYVYGMVEPSGSIAATALFGIFAGNQPKPFVLNFSEKGIAFLELNSMCSAFTDLHNFVAADRIESLLFNKGLLINTLTIQTTDGNKQKIKISNLTASASWQKDNVKKMADFIQTYNK